MPIVTSTYRYKRPPRKRKPVEIDVPVIVTPADPKKGRRRREQAAAEDIPGGYPHGDGQAGKQQPNPPTTARKPSIVTVRDRKTVQRQREQQQMAKLMQGEGSQPELLPTVGKKSAIVTMRSAGEDMTPEEHQRRGDAADAMFQEMKRRIAEQS
jgi:hypothetical protein